MIRNLKVLGLALVAVFAMSAIAASGASAEANLTAESYPASLLGHDLEEEGLPNSLEGLGQTIECSEAAYSGELAEASSTVEITPEYAGCFTTSGRFVTVTHNGCNYTFHAETGETDTNPVTADLHCPEGQVIEVHIFNDVAHTELYCTVTVDPTTGLTGLTAHSQTKTGDIQLTGSVKPPITTHGACSFGLTISAESTLNVNVTLEGRDEENNKNPIHIG